MIKRIIIAVVLLAAIIVGGTGCMANRQNENNDNAASTNDLALAYLEEKYGETFTYAAPWGNSMTGNREFLTTCDSLPGQAVLVQVENFKDDEPTYKDNYLEVKYLIDTTEYFRDAAAEVFGDAIVHYEASKLSLSSDLSKYTPFDSFYQHPTTYMVVYLEIKQSNYTSPDQFALLFSKLKESQGQIKVRVIVVKDDIYGTLDTNALNLLPYEGKAIADAFAETENGSFQFDLSEEG